MPNQSTITRKPRRSANLAAAIAKFPPAAALRQRVEAVLAGFRSWPSWVFYAPVAARALWCGVQHRDLSLVAISNPLANKGGNVISSSKSAIFGSMGPAEREWVAPYAVVKRPAERDIREATARARSSMEAAGLVFPIVAKPDQGSGGKGVRVLASADALRRYLKAFPPDQDILLQELVEGPHEAGVMYVRPPGAQTGRIESLALKEAPSVIGDGAMPLRELIETHPHARHLRKAAFADHADALDSVPEKGQRIELVFARNRCGGAICHDRRDLITPELTDRIEAIARSMPSFHIGRFDIRFASTEQLKTGEGFRILEVNCGASEPLAAWDPANHVVDAWRAYFDQVDRLYEYGAAHRARGYESPGTAAFLRGLWRQHRNMGAAGPEAR